MDKKIKRTFDPSLLPHHRLRAHTVARAFLQAVRAAQITDRKFREHALGSAKSAALNSAEGAGRMSRGDKGRAYAIARGEAVEAIAAVEICVDCGEARPEALAEVHTTGCELVALLTGLVR